jgi:hypothetical protein
VLLTGLSSGGIYYYRITALDQIGLETTSSNVTLVLTEGPIIEIWYGLNQTFGNIGVPQQWINILGNVTDLDGLNQLTFSLNGGIEQNLSVGPFRRLSEPGDFNVEVDFDDLFDGVNQVDITAVDTNGNISKQTVLINYPYGNVWPIDYNIDWASVNKIEDVAQIVDGLWEISGNELRPSNTGYDRTVAIGDIRWSDYEVLVPITIHGFDPAGFEGINGAPAVGVMMKWPGHSDWTGNQQPNYGYYPTGGAAWYNYNLDGTGRLLLTDFQSLYRRETISRSLLNEVTYFFKVRVETVIAGAKYSIKVWESAQQEPAEWDIVDVDTNDVDGGSLLLIAHFVDVSFGNITIQPIGVNNF